MQRARTVVRSESCSKFGSMSKKTYPRSIVLTQRLQEFEFPAYFTYFVRKLKCTLVVDSPLAEADIRSVFGETLLGPSHFRDHITPLPNVDEDFDPSFPKERRPNFYKELGQFRANEKTDEYDELEIDTLVRFTHFKSCRKDAPHQDNMLGVPPDLQLVQLENGNDSLYFGNDSIRFGNDSVRFGNDSASLLLSPPLESPFSRNRAGGVTPPSNSSEKASISISGDRMSELNTIISVSSASDTSSRQHVQRRGSLVSISSASILDSSGSSLGVLRRSNSDGSLSVHSQESGGLGSMRRSSMGTFAKKPPSLRDVLESNRPSWTPGGGLLKRHASQKFHQSTVLPSIPVRTKPRREISMANLTSRAHISPKPPTKKVSGSPSDVDYDFMMDDEPDGQDANWMYSQAKWLGRFD